MTRREMLLHCSREWGLEAFVGSAIRRSILFPRASPVVHHAGVGTLSEALKAVRPQLVTPYLGERQDDVPRLVKLGVARPSPRDGSRKSRPAVRETRKLQNRT